MPAPAIIMPQVAGSGTPDGGDASVKLPEMAEPAPPVWLKVKVSDAAPGPNEASVPVGVKVPTVYSERTLLSGEVDALNDDTVPANEPKALLKLIAEPTVAVTDERTTPAPAVMLLKSPVPVPDTTAEVLVKVPPAAKPPVLPTLNCTTGRVPLIVVAAEATEGAATAAVAAASRVRTRVRIKPPIRLTADAGSATLSSTETDWTSITIYGLLRTVTGANKLCDPF